jgi:hypothetical protein
MIILSCFCIRMSVVKLLLKKTRGFHCLVSILSTSHMLKTNKLFIYAYKYINRNIHINTSIITQSIVIVSYIWFSCESLILSNSFFIVHFLYFNLYSYDRKRSVIWLVSIIYIFLHVKDLKIHCLFFNNAVTLFTLEVSVYCINLKIVVTLCFVPGIYSVIWMYSE